MGALVLEPDDIFKMTVCCYTPEQIGLNISYWKMGTPTGADPFTETTVATDANGYFTTAYKNMLSAAARYRGVRIQKVLTAPFVSAGQTVVASDGVGNGGGTLQATQTATVISFSTDLSNPWFRGRVYIPFPPADANDANGSPDGAFNALAAAMAVKYFGPMPLTSGASTNSAYLVIRSAAAPLADPVRGLTYPYVTKVRSADKWGTQRRRSQYGAHNVLPF